MVEGEEDEGIGDTSLIRRIGYVYMVWRTVLLWIGEGGDA